MRDDRIRERLDPAAAYVLDAAWDEAADFGERAVGTEHLLLALAGADPTTAQLLADAGASAADLRRTFAERRPVPPRRPGPGGLLATLGIDLDEVRSRAERSFGAERISRAAARVRVHTRRRRRPLRTWISCSRPLPSRAWESPLAGGQLPAIPRVTRLLRRATRLASSERTAPVHLLLALLEGNEPACELLDDLAVDVGALTDATRRRPT